MNYSNLDARLGNGLGEFLAEELHALYELNDLQANKIRKLNELNVDLRTEVASQRTIIEDMGQSNNRLRNRNVRLNGISYESLRLTNYWKEQYEAQKTYIAALENSVFALQNRGNNRSGSEEIQNRRFAQANINRRTRAGLS